MPEPNKIKTRLVSILEDKFRIKLDSLPDGWEHMHFLGNVFRFVARDLLVLLYYVERDFGITVPKREILAGKFSTFADLVEIIGSEFRNGEKRS